MVWTLIYHCKLANQIARLAEIVVKNNLSLLTIGKYLCFYFTFFSISDAFEMTDVWKGERKRKQGEKFSNLEGKKILSIVLVVQLCTHACAFSIVFKNKLFLSLFAGNLCIRLFQKRLLL